MTVLETERLRLRPWRDDDLEHLARLNADERFVEFLGARPMTREQTEGHLARYRRHWDDHGFGLWAAEERATGGFVGRIGLSHHAALPEEVELGWAVDPERWRRGYATEGGRAALRHGFETLGLDRVISIIHPDNTPSIRVAEKLGERPWRTVFFEPLGIDLTVYAIERQRWLHP